MLRGIRYFLMALSTCLLFACVYSQNPLSNEKTSKVDERLIGKWIRFENGRLSEGSVVIDRIAGTENTLQMIEFDYSDDGTVSAKNAVLFTRPGKTNYFSLRMESEKDDEDPGYLIAKYDFPDELTWRWHLLDMDLFAKAVEEEKLKGRVEREIKGKPANEDESAKTDNADEQNKGEVQAVLLSDSPEAIIQFLEKHGEACYLDEALIHKKIGSGQSKP